MVTPLSRRASTCRSGTQVVETSTSLDLAYILSLLPALRALALRWRDHRPAVAAQKVEGLWQGSQVVYALT